MFIIFTYLEDHMVTYSLVCKLQLYNLWLFFGGGGDCLNVNPYLHLILTKNIALGENPISTPERNVWIFYGTESAQRTLRDISQDGEIRNFSSDFFKLL